MQISSQSPQRAKRLPAGAVEVFTEAESKEAVLKAGALQNAILNSANFSSIATDAKGVIQIFNVGAERMLGYVAADVLNNITPADISDPQELIARAKTLSAELATTIAPGFEALVFKASRGIEDIYELTYIRKDGSRFPAIVSVTALRDANGAIIGYLLIGTDNTVRNQIKHALQQSEERYTTLFNTMFEGFCLIEVLFNADGKAIDYRFLETNKAFEKQTGLMDAKGRRIRELVPELEEYWFELYGKVAVTGESAHLVNEARALNRWFEVSAQRFGDASDRRVSILFQDITARKRAEEALLKAGALQAAIFNSANFSSIATDAKGIIQIFNVGAERMLGYAAADVLNKITPADISDPQELIARAKALSAELATTIAPGFEALVFKASRGIEDIYELTYIRKDGSRFPAIVSVTALRDAQEAVIGYLLIGTDNTARKESEEERMKLDQQLRDQQFYHKIVMFSPDAHFVHVDGLITFVNQAFCRLMGAAEPAQLLGRPAQEAVHPDYRELVLKQQQKILDDQPMPPFEMKFIRLDGIAVDVEVASIAFDFRGHEEIQVIARDITERKRHDAQFLQAQKMEALGQFSGGIAHDFNNILSAIVGYSQLSKLILKKNPEVREHLDAVLKAASRATALIRQILAFSRQQPEERQAIDLRPIMAESIGLLRATIPSSIEFDTSIAADVPKVLANAGQIHQILMNLGVNAWHAMKDLPGRLQVKLERCVVDAAHAATQPQLRPGVYARVSVSDTGRGMDPATLRRIFEPFFTTKLPGEGTGLGLAVVHGIMVSHDGAVTVYSQPGEGSIFHLYFPAYAGATTAAAAIDEDGPTPRGQGEWILIVDDEELLIQLGLKTLVTLGYKVEATTRPAAALAMVRAAPQRFALVLTDQAMPDMTGLLLASQLRQIRPELPIILMTGYSVSLTPDVLEAAGVCQLLLKPINLHSLGTAVHAALAAKPPL
jgi:PAS domain S-box-containing protein